MFLQPASAADTVKMKCIICVIYFTRCLGEKLTHCHDWMSAAHAVQAYRSGPNKTPFCVYEDELLWAADELFG